LVSTFGERTLEILKHDPVRVAQEIRGITLERAQEIREALLAIEEMEAVEVAVRGLVAPAGVTTRQLHAILERYGREAASVVRANPYRLIDEVAGVGWTTADKIGRATGFDAGAPERLRAGIVHALREAEDDGHTCLSRSALVGLAAGVLGRGVPEVERRLEALVASRELVTYTPSGGPDESPVEERIYLRETHEAEESVAGAIVAFLEPAPLAGGPDPDEAWDEP
jgi:exodeoxyribonuclease V alpha subunit